MDKFEKIKEWYYSSNSAFPFDIYKLNDQTVNNCYDLLFNIIVTEPNNDFATMIYADFFNQIKKDYAKSKEYYEKLLNSEYMYMKTGALSTIGMMYQNGQLGYKSDAGKEYIEKAADSDDVLAIKIAANYETDPMKKICLLERICELSQSNRDDLSNCKWYKCDDNTVQNIVALYMVLGDYEGLLNSAQKHFRNDLPTILEMYFNKVRLEDVSDEILDLVVNLDQETVNNNEKLTTMFKMFVRLLKRERETTSNSLLEIVI